MIETSRLHHDIIEHFIEHGYAPSIATLSALLDQPRQSVTTALHALQAEHGVVLHPDSSEIWVAHPFSSAPTNFWVRNARRGWWGNCAWCSMGIVALLGTDASVATTLGGEATHVTVDVVDGVVSPADLLVHFPIPMQHAWDNVVYTCSNMLLFDSEAHIGSWSARHGMPRGDVQPLEKIWQFARVWYGRHRDPEWKKWSASEAREIFATFGLSGPTWEIPESSDRF
ncbi:MAG TPA: alkylmercury lyase family protein [Gemmatimonadaceae bacterium]|nr:alkylmercury lyase family protein [Gemmatimonadaceae bacterium]